MSENKGLERALKIAVRIERALLDVGWMPSQSLLNPCPLIAQIIFAAHAPPPADHWDIDKIVREINSYYNAVAIHDFMGGQKKEPIKFGQIQIDFVREAILSRFSPPADEREMEYPAMQPESIVLPKKPPPANHQAVAEEIIEAIAKCERLDIAIKKADIAAILSRSACRCGEYRELLVRAYPFVCKFGYSFTAKDILAALEGGEEGA